MSEAKNFRIGNLILLNGNIITVSGIDQYGINPEVNRGVESYDYYFDNTDNDKLDGIPLTEEWMIRFGFEKIERQAPNTFIGFKLGEFLISIDLFNGNFVFYIESPYTFIQKTVIKYVHHLQDLYQAIKLEKLPIKLEPNG